jgi:hypothetical protein
VFYPALSLAQDSRVVLEHTIGADNALQSAVTVLAGINSPESTATFAAIYGRTALIAFRTNINRLVAIDVSRIEHIATTVTFDCNPSQIVLVFSAHRISFPPGGQQMQGGSPASTTDPDQMSGYRS